MKQQPLEDHSLLTEANFSQFIRFHRTKIISSILCLLALGGIIEGYHYLEERQAQQAQLYFEDYLSEPAVAKTQKLQRTYPKHIQTQLVSLLEAKRQFADKRYHLTEQHLAFVMNHAQEEVIRQIALTRLSSLYQMLEQHEKSQALYAYLENHNAYSKLYQALVTDDPKQKESLLNEALSEHSHPFETQLITLLHYQNLKEQ